MSVERTLLHRGYEVTLAVVIVSSVLYSGGVLLLVTALRGVSGELGAPGLLAVVLFAAATASITAVQVGPLWASRLELTWLDPLTLVRRRRRLVALAVLVICLSLGLIVATAANRTGLPGTAIGVASAALLLLVVILAHVGQLLDATGWVRGGGLVCAVAATTIIAGSTGTVQLVIAAACLLYLAALSARVQQRPVPIREPTATPPRWELVRAGAFVEALRASTVMLDASALELVRDARLCPEPSRTPNRESVLFAVRALTSSRIVVLLPALCLPAAAGSIWGAGAAACTLSLTTFFFAWRLSRPFDVYMSHPALRRTYAARGPRLPVLVGGTTLGLTLLYACCGAVAGSLSSLWCLAAFAFAILGILRRLSGRRLTGRVGGLLATPMGPIPVDVARRVMAGADVFILSAAVCLTQDAATSAALAGLITAVYFVVFTLRGR